MIKDIASLVVLAMYLFLRGKVQCWEGRSSCSSSVSCQWGLYPFPLFVHVGMLGSALGHALDQLVPTCCPNVGSPST